MPPRFYSAPLPDPALPDPCCKLDPDETRHARRVLRLGPGDAVVLFDGAGGVADAVITGYEAAAAVCRVSARRQEFLPGPRLTVGAAVPKGSRGEAMVDQLGQLGVAAFVPLRCARGVVEPSQGKVQRYAKTALASAKQSGRAWVMAVEPMVGLAELLGRRWDRGLILDPAGTADAAAELAQARSTWFTEDAEIAVLVGPEGGWSDEELAAAAAVGFVRWRIAAHVLRIETAATAAAAILGHSSLSG
ncbi:MAG: RsmE family RNA methyltransferase [Planctomycetota bacterium]